MRFRIQAKDDDNIQRYPTSDLKIARVFSDKLKKELQDFLSSVVVFGSSARKTQHKNSDIDVLIIGNDLDFKLSQPFLETYRLIIERTIMNTSGKLHVTSMTMSSFWEYARAGDPIVTNILRDGVTLHDNGSFRPLQQLLRQGRVRPTEESVWRYFARAPKTLNNSRWHIMQGTLDLYWAVIDSAHAALMAKDTIPPSPDHVAAMLNKVFVKSKELEPKYVELMTKFYNLNKDITHRKIQHINGRDYDHLYKEAGEFVNRMKKLIRKHEL
ncbi:hypothetical protein HOA92_07165 [archaeon]|jgi:uncharacterized protein (UPF0332 family)/predicted nucleotidyltransferase|nr:hypothetical protein [archaeon]MBT6762792.1 hypothetical protein [archaeon]